MGAIGGLLGASGGVNGTGIKGPQSTDIQQGVTTDQTQQAYNNANGALGSQQALLQALQGQGGIQNQASAQWQAQQLQNQLDRVQGVGNQNAALQQQQALTQALAANNGAQNLGSTFNQSQALANQLAGANAVGSTSQALQAQQQLSQQQQATAQQYQNIANGTGPNPAQAMLNQATGANVANQAALMAGQRGAGANVGLLARQAAQQGANTQQQAVGQAAQMQANQQIAGLQGLSAQQQAIGGTNQNVANIAAQQLAAQQAQQQALSGQAAQQVGLQQAGTTAQAQIAAAQVAQQQAQQQALAQQAATQVGQQIGATTTNTQAQQAEQGQLLNALGAQNQVKAGMQGNINSANAGLAAQTMQGQQGLIGGGLNAAGAALGAAYGGEIHKMADGGDTTSTPGSFGQFLQNFGTGMTGSNSGAQSITAGMTNLGNGIKSYMKKPGPGGADGGGSKIAEVAPMSMLAGGGLANSGGPVKAKTPDQKAAKPGNSYDNDKIPAMLSEGEIVIPRDVLQSSDPISGAAEFVRQTLSKRKAPKDGTVYAADGVDTGDPSAPQPPPPDSESDSSVEPVEVVGQRNPQQIATDMNNRDLEFQQMLQRGQIHPKTYSDLYNDKGTLGKIGTLFGLMVSGAGAGLSHQPNMVMQMMDNQIQRDLDAQKASAANSQNWYNMAIAHELQKHQQAGLDAGTASSVLKNDQDRANYLRAFPEADLSATNTAYNAQTLSALQMQQDIVNRMPPGPLKQQAQMVLDKTSQAAYGKIAQNNLSTANQIAQVQKAKNGGFSNGINENLLSDAITRGASSNIKAPGLVMPGEAGVIQAEKSAVQSNQDHWKQVHDTFNYLAGLPLGGEVPGAAGVGTAIGSAGLAGGPILGSLTSGLGHVVGKMTEKAFQSERGDRIGLIAKQTGLTPDELDQVLPKWTDVNDPKKLKLAHDSAYNYFHNKEIGLSGNLRTLNNQLGGKLFQELPKYGIKAVKQSAPVSEEKENKPQDIMSVFGLH